MSGIDNFVRKMEAVEKIIHTFPNKAAIQAVAFSKERFVQQNWVDARTEPWKSRKETGRQRTKNRGRAILIKSGKYKRSIRKKRVGRNFAVIGSDVVYAKPHNEGISPQPRRQVMGNSRVLAQRIERGLAADLLKALR